MRRSRLSPALVPVTPLMSLGFAPSRAPETSSVIAVYLSSGRVVVSSATCVAQGRFAGFPALGLMDIQAIVVPGVGVAAAQAGVDNTRANQTLIYDELKAGTDPRLILDMLRADPDICLLYTSPSPRDLSTSRMPSSA